jgi:CHC2 zinc finger
VLTVPQSKTINPAHTRRYFETRLADQALSGKAQVLVRCPLHEDRKPSLSVNLDKGVWCCHAGCGDGGILDFEERFSRCDRNTARGNIDAILGERLLTTTNGREPLATYRYTDAHGKLLFEKLRYEPKGLPLSSRR